MFTVLTQASNNLECSEETEPPSLSQSPRRASRTPFLKTSKESSLRVLGVDHAPVSSVRAEEEAAVEAVVPCPEPKESANPSRAMIFREHYYPDVSEVQWSDWKWQVRNRIKDLKGMERILQLSEPERAVFSQPGRGLPVGITPYYASVLDPANPAQGIRRSVVALPDESILSPGESIDPLGEDHDSPVPGLVHRYPDRVLFLVTGFCSTYCRYCTRARMVGNQGEVQFNVSQWEKAIAYIEQNPAIRDVLLSGGDPLTLGDDRLEWLLSRLSAIPHVEFLRIGSKVPVVLPQRITPNLVQILRKYQPLWMSIHFLHPDEITPEVQHACSQLADAGIPLGSQTVLLAGVNDEVEIMKRLVHGLLRMRVRPYYLYQCDPIQGSSHFRTPVSKGLEIIQGLRGHTTGYAVPTYVIDAPGGGGKVPLLPEYVVGREGDSLLIRNFEGKIYSYPDPCPKGDPS